MVKRSLIGVVAAFFIAPSVVAAADIPISASKLVVKTEPASAKRRFLFKTVKESAVVLAGNPTAGGATLFVAGLACTGPDCVVSGSSGSIHLPAAKWTGLGNPPGSSGYRYKDTDATEGGVRVALLKAGKLVVKATGSNWPWLPAGGEDGIVVTLQVGANRYCAEFGGTEKDNEPGLLSYRDAAAPPSCRALCGNDVRESDETCDGADADACAGLCQTDCTCPAPVCGNGVLEAGEECDGESSLPGFLECVDCVNCMEDGVSGCSSPSGSYPCCNPESSCRALGPNATECRPPSGLGGSCLDLAPSAPVCEPGLFCDVFSTTCCSTSGCSGDGDCCHDGVCEGGECCLNNGGSCAVIDDFVFRCCAGQKCCSGTNCPDLDTVDSFFGICCGDVGSTCTSGTECCSGACNAILGECL